MIVFLLGNSSFFFYLNTANLKSVSAFPITCFVCLFLDGKMVLLVLNSLYWSVAVKRSVETDQKASKQLVWLENQLRLAKSHGQKAMLASHIPAG